MDVARLNFSHGDRASHGRFIRMVRDASRQVGRPLGILADLCGPKIRVAALPEGEKRLRAGGTLILSSRVRPRGTVAVGTTYPRLAADLSRGNRVLLDDGKIRLRVQSIAGGEVRCRVVEGGTLRSHQGINLPGVGLSAPALTSKDRDDLAFALEQGVDLVALSFVRRASDVRRAVGFIRRRTGAKGKTGRGAPPFAAASPPVIAKLEKPQALDDLEGILAVAGGVMVARGDLGVEIAPERVPVVQKRIIRRANAVGSPVITATQMLESMTDHSRPTRAEASDVANAVLDGTDAVMLSAETAVGRYPVESVRMMDRIIREIERQGTGRRGAVEEALSTEDAVAGGAVSLAVDVGAAAIVAFTLSGSTALRLARRRPPMPIVALSPHEAVVRRLSLVWGVISQVVPEHARLARLVARAEQALRDLRLVRTGQSTVLVMGYPPGISGSTNLIKLHVVGESI